MGFKTPRDMRHYLTSKEYFEWMIFLRMQAKGQKPFMQEEEIGESLQRIFGGNRSKS